MSQPVFEVEVSARYRLLDVLRMASNWISMFRISMAPLLTVCAWMLVTVVGCAPLPDDEAALILEDLGAGMRQSRFKELTPEPVLLPITYSVDDRNYQGDLYQPGEQPLAAIVLVPGAAEKGSEDPRLVAFANTLARSRFMVLVPDLLNLRALKVRAEDAQGVADAFMHLMSRPDFPGRGRAGIGAFSYAVGPAVLAALKLEIRDHVDFILGVGGYHDLRQVVTFFTTGYYRKNGQWSYLEPNRYGKWVFMLSNLDRLRDSKDRHTFRLMAKRRLADPQASISDLAGTLSFDGSALLALLENDDRDKVPAMIERLPKAIRADMDALTLANKDLSRLNAQLILLHGTDDTIIPYTESVALAEAAAGVQPELFLIDGLAHVDIYPLGLDRRAMWQAIHALLAQREALQIKNNN